MQITVKHPKVIPGFHSVAAFKAITTIPCSGSDGAVHRCVDETTRADP